MHFLLLLLLSTSLFAALSSEASAKDRKPNIILINIDDLGYADIGPFGGKAPTPHLDRMAREGMKLTSHYAAPVCSPSRAAMMTGCYPKRVLPIPHVLFPAAAVGLNPDEMTVAEVLKSRGYATACVGKWHLGDQPEFMPTAQGFDTYLGIPYSNDMGPRSDGAKSNPGQPTAKGKAKGGKGAAAKSQAEDETGLKGDNQPPLPMIEGGKVAGRVDAAGQHAMTRRYTDRAVQFIREQREKPFFLYLPHNAVHFPLYPHQDYLGKSGISLQKDWVMEVDGSVGRILGTLRELKLEADTLVVFTSDNGGPLNQGADNRPFRGSKGSTLEGGIRVCTLAWWPGRVAAGSSTPSITSHMDWLPTFAALAGGSPPQDRKIDGIDLSPLLLGDAGSFKGRDVFYYYAGFKLQAVRSGRWKLHLANQELYNLDEDPGESKNLFPAHPEEATRLTALAGAMEDDLGLDGPEAPGVRPLGRVAHPRPWIQP
jgi:arylsulfatase A-like enzyme